MTKDAKLEAGVDTLRDPITGVVYDIERIWLPENVRASPYMRGSSNETCALNGPKVTRENKCSHFSRAHQGPKEAA